LHESQRSGQGQVVDAAIVDGTASLMTFMYGMLEAGTWVDERGVNPLDGGRPWYDMYRTADDEYMAVGAIEGRFYAEFVDRLGLSEADGRRRNPDDWPALRERIASAFASRSRAEWEEVFDGSDACVAPVLGMREAPAHQHLRARSTYVELDGVTQPAPAPRFSRTPGRCRLPPPAPGEHSREVMSAWGLEPIDAWLASGVVRQR
jgi:alpha-methylacyl-CoA racemase